MKAKIGVVMCPAWSLETPPLSLGLFSLLPLIAYNSTLLSPFSKTWGIPHKNLANLWFAGSKDFTSGSERNWLITSIFFGSNVAITGPPAYPRPVIKSSNGFFSIANESISDPNNFWSKWIT